MSGKRCRSRSSVASHRDRRLRMVLGTLAAAAVAAHQVLRPGSDLAAGHPADRPARHHHRHRAALGLFAGRNPLLVLDDRARPRHLLRRRRLQQRGGPLPPHLGFADRGLHGSRRRRLPDLPSCRSCRISPRRFSPAACSPSLCPSTRSSSPPSPPASSQTVPIWMLEELIRPRQRPVTNVVAMVVVHGDVPADPGGLLSDPRHRPDRRQRQMNTPSEQHIAYRDDRRSSANSYSQIATRS